jgi:hypothetical protein
MRTSNRAALFRGRIIRPSSQLLNAFTMAMWDICEPFSKECGHRCSQSCPCQRSLADGLSGIATSPSYDQKCRNTGQSCSSRAALEPVLSPTQLSLDCRYVPTGQRQTLTDSEDNAWGQTYGLLYNTVVPITNHRARSCAKTKCFLSGIAAKHLWKRLLAVSQILPPLSIDRGQPTRYSRTGRLS